MNPFLAKSVCLSLLLLSMLAVKLDAPAQSGDYYIMDGKRVPRSFYDAGQLILEGNDLLRANRNQEASVKLQQALAIAPDFPEAHHNYGLAMAKLGNYPAAIEQFQLALKLKPSFDSALLSLGGMYQSTGRMQEAIATYKEFLTRFPQSPDASKVASLVQGLQRESSNSSNPGAPTHLGTTPPSAAAPDDYLADVTRTGTLRWPADRLPLKVYVRSGANVPGFDPKYDAILKKSFDDWSRASGGTVKFVYIPTPAQADIDVTWTNDPSKLANTAEAGETRLTSNRFGVVHGTIQLLTVPLLPGATVTPSRIRLISLHEIGHVLGLTGHTSNPDDTMFYSSTISDSWRDLSARDANTIARLYNSSKVVNQTNSIPEDPATDWHKADKSFRDAHMDVDAPAVKNGP
jgi:tetratricopeptide (TPR) repeat protein